MSDSTKHALYVVAESTYGETPASPSMSRVRNTTCSLALAKEGVGSEEQDPSRMVTDYRHGNRQVAGEIGFELSYGGSFNILMAACLMGAWAAKMDLEGATFSVASGDGSFNDSADGFPQLHPGDIFTVAGFTTPANNGSFKVVTATKSKIVVTKANGDAHGLTTEVAGDTVTLVSEAEILKAGATRQSLSVLRHFSDQGNGDKPYHLFTGVMVNTMGLTVSPNAIVKGTFGLIGKAMSLSDTAPASATLGAASSTRVFDAFNGSLTEGGAANAYITELQMSIENGIEPNFVLFNPETVDPSVGRFQLSGTIGVHFRNAAMLEKFLNEESTAIVFDLTDLDGNTYRFRMPRVTLNGGQPDTAAAGTILLSMPFVALLDSTSGTTLTVERIPA